MRKAERKRGTSRKDYYTGVVLLTSMAALVLRIPLGHLIGNSGIAYFSLANEIYFVVAGLFAYGLSEAAAALIRYRIRREQYKSAQKVLSGAMFFGFIAGVVLCALFGFLGGILADKIFGIPLAGLSLRLMAPAIVFFILTGVLRGYFQGNGSKMPAIHSQALHMIVLIAGSLLGGASFHRYGEKVSALLQNQAHAGAYGAMGASIGILAAGVLGFLHMLALYLIFGRNIKRQASRELQKNQDAWFHILHMLAGTGAIHAAYYFIFSSLPLIDAALFFRMGAGEQDLTELWGNYYGRYLVVIGILNCALNLLCVGTVRRISSFIDREEYRMARGRMGELIHWSAVSAMPAAVFVAILAENILNLFFKGNNQQTALWLQIGSVSIIFYLFAAVFMELLIRMKRFNLVVLSGAGALVVHILLVVFLLSGTELLVISLVIGGIAFYGIVAAAGFLIAGKSIQYKQEWIKSFAVTAVAAAIAGVIVMLLNKVFSPIVGSSISLVICLLLGIAVYFVLLLAARGFREDELTESAFGRFLLMIARKLHFME